ncbi:hypothetical protein NMR94_003533, partial [Vibrio cholerae]|nr:hypothetical protein [Vibrio cholerae]
MDFSPKFKVLILLFNILTIAIFPSLAYVTLNLESLGLGYLISIAITLSILFVFCRRLSKVNLIICILTVLFILAFSTSDLLIDPGKIFGSIVAFTLMMLSANLMSKYLLEMTSDEIYNFISSVIIWLLVAGVAGVSFDIKFLGYEKFPKSIFTFYEPSHYAITVGPFFVAAMIVLRKYRMMICAAFLFISLSSQNLTILLYWSLGTWLSLENRKVKLVFLTIVIVALAILYIYSSSSFDYYTERIKISSESNNLSTLVYLQGWDEMRKSLYDSLGLGLGFQQAGSNDPGIYAERIYEISNIYKNRQDAGFLSAKIVIEFGMVGVLFITLYIKIFISSLKGLKYLDNNLDKMISGFILALFIEMFFRGQGYFTLGFYLL